MPSNTGPVTYRVVCKYKGCKTRQLWNFPGKKCFFFPRNFERRCLWGENAGFPPAKEMEMINGKMVRRDYAICADHFYDHDFANELKQKLNWNAAPIPWWKQNEVSVEISNCEESATKNPQKIDQEKQQVESTRVEPALKQIFSTSRITIDTEETSPLETSATFSLRYSNDPTKDIHVYKYIPVNDKTISSIFNDSDANSNNNSDCSDVVISADSGIEQIENSSSNVQKQRDKALLFRKLCSTPLKLPSVTWTTISNPKNDYFLICQVDYNTKFSVNKGVRFTADMTCPDIHIGDTKVSLTGYENVSSVEDVQRLVYELDKLVLCPGTGLQDVKNSKSCTGVARICDDQQVIPCVACSILKLIDKQRKCQY